ncbi:MAG: FtsX-like permease family protein [Myxococcaceae bacterium]
MRSRLPALAIRNVGRNRRRSAITLVALFVCVMMVMALRGVVDGASALMVSDVVDGRSGAIQIHKAGYVDSIEAVPTSLNLPYDPALIAKVKTVKGVTGVTGRIAFSGLIGNGQTQTMFIGRGIDLTHEKDACSRADSVVKSGRALGEGDKLDVMVGYELGESFGLKVGEHANLQTTSPGGRANAMDLTVRGFSTSSFPFENKRVATVPLATAQDLLGMPGRVTELALAVDDLEQIDVIRDRLKNTLGPEYEVHTWKELQAFVRDVINRQNIVMGLISLVFFVIAFTVIANTMLMSVFERVREIGTLLAVGLRRRQVLTLFMLEAATLGVLGAASGAVAGRIVLGIISSVGIPLQLPGTSGMAMLRPMVTPRFIVLTMIAATVGSVLASAVPAWRASRLNPVDALRNA